MTTHFDLCGDITSLLDDGARAQDQAIFVDIVDEGGVEHAHVPAEDARFKVTLPRKLL
jgi:hypothetical protein